MYSLLGSSQSIRLRYLLGAGCLLVVVLPVAGIVWYRATHRPLVPKSISDQASITLFVPHGQGITIQPSSFKYDKKQQSFGYVARFEGATIVVSEQPAPAVFTDVPGYYAKWLDSFGQYDSFGSGIGTVELVRSAKLNTYPVAVLATKGTLLFAKPDKQLNDMAWRRLFLPMRAAN